jgi:hypothetical protein
MSTLSNDVELKDLSDSETTVSARVHNGQIQCCVHVHCCENEHWLQRPGRYEPGRDRPPHSATVRQPRQQGVKL